MELEECPFCGNENPELHGIKGYYYIMCGECLIETGMYISEKDVVEKWNRRDGGNSG